MNLKKINLFFIVSVLSMSVLGVSLLALKKPHFLAINTTHTITNEKPSKSSNDYYSTPSSTNASDWYTAKEYQERMGVGMDVDWSKIKESMETFTEKTVTDFADKGLKHVRIRVKERATESQGWGIYKDWRTTIPADADFVKGSDLQGGEVVSPANLPQRLYEYKTLEKPTDIGLDYQIKTTIDGGMLPVLAYQASEFKEHPVKELDNVVEWWKTTAEHYKNYPKELAFNLLIEFTDDLHDSESVADEFANENISEPMKQFFEDAYPDDDDYKKEYDDKYKKINNPIWEDVPQVVREKFLISQMNKLTTRIHEEVRKVSKYRIVIMPPIKISNPYYLPYMNLPSNEAGDKVDPYLMAEWHFYAAGPSKKIGGPKVWTVGTASEQKEIIDKIDFAKSWSDSSAVPTWVGAWMPNNFNTNPQGNSLGEFTVKEQMVFAMFMSCQLKKRGIPHAVNSDSKYYEREKQMWLHYPSQNKSHVILDAIINPNVDPDTCFEYPRKQG